MVEAKSFFESYLEINLLLGATVTLLGVLVGGGPVSYFTRNFELKIKNLCWGQLLATDLDSTVLDVFEGSAPVDFVSVPRLAIEYLQPVV